MVVARSVTAQRTGVRFPPAPPPPPPPRVEGEATEVSALDREEPPGAGYALELVVATVVEPDARADDEIGDRARDQHLGRTRSRADALPDVHGHAADVVATDLDLADVDADSDGDT